MFVHSMFVSTCHLYKYTYTYIGIGDVCLLKIEIRGDIYMTHCRAIQYIDHRLFCLHGDV